MAALIKSKLEKEENNKKSATKAAYYAKYKNNLDSIGQIRWNLTNREDWEVLEFLQKEFEKLILKASKNEK